MIVSGNITQDCCPGEPTDDRHDELEQPEVEGQPEDGPRTGGCFLSPCSKTDGESVHGHAEGDQENYKEIHIC